MFETIIIRRLDIRRIDVRPCGDRIDSCSSNWGCRWRTPAPVPASIRSSLFRVHSVRKALRRWTCRRQSAPPFYVGSKRLPKDALEGASWKRQGDNHKSCRIHLGANRRRVSPGISEEVCDLLDGTPSLTKRVARLRRSRCAPSLGTGFPRVASVCSRCRQSLEGSSGL